MGTYKMGLIELIQHSLASKMLACFYSSNEAVVGATHYYNHLYMWPSRNHENLDFVLQSALIFSLGKMEVEVEVSVNIASSAGSVFSFMERQADLISPPSAGASLILKVLL